MTQAARACIMGHPVAHSRSPMLHGYWLRTLGIDGAYEFADVAPENFETFFRGLARTALPAATSRCRTRKRRSGWSTGASAPPTRSARSTPSGTRTARWSAATPTGSASSRSLDDDPSRLGCVARQGRRARRRRLGARRRSMRFSSAAFRSRSSTARAARAEKLAARIRRARIGARLRRAAGASRRCRRADQHHLARHGRQSAARSSISAAEALGDRLRCRLCAARNRAAESRQGAPATAPSTA